MSAASRDPRLDGLVYHGSARHNRSFFEKGPAYFTPSLALAREYAYMDAEVDGGTPFVVTARVLASSPVTMDITTLQDLHYNELRGFFDYLIGRGHDCAVPDDPTSKSEIVIFGAAGIKIVSYDPIPDRSVWLAELLSK